MKISFQINLELPDDDLTEAEQVRFAESVQVAMKAKQYGLNKSILSRIYDNIRKSNFQQKAKTLILPN